MERQLTFIVIDDNVIDILIYKMLLKSIFNNANIIYFTEAKEALAFIQDTYPVGQNSDTILLLDINMPVMNGWEFLNEFERLHEKIKGQIRICIVSFYVNPENEELAALNPHVELILSKPINREKILSIVNMCKAEK